MKRDKLIAVGATALLTLLLVGAAAAVYARAGWYDVAATTGHAAPVEWLVETLAERSIERRARALPEAPPFDSVALAHGFEHFHAMCVECHGAPGMEPDEFAEGLYPQAPELSDEAEEWTARELFWITKHGIKLTGMPAFGPTHTDEQIWGIVGFLQRLPELTPAEYARMAAALEASGGGHHGAEAAEAGADDHAHAPGTGAHAH